MAQSSHDAFMAMTFGPPCTEQSEQAHQEETEEEEEQAYEEEPCPPCTEEEEGEELDEEQKLAILQELIDPQQEAEEEEAKEDEEEANDELRWWRQWQGRLKESFKSDPGCLDLWREYLCERRRRLLGFPDVSGNLKERRKKERRSLPESHYPGRNCCPG